MTGQADPSILIALGGLILALVVQTIALIKFLLRVEAKAKAADRTANEAKDLAITAHEQTSAQALECAKCRGNIAAEYVRRQALIDIEERVIKGVQSVETRLAAAIEGLCQRVDRLFEQRGDLSR